MDDLREKYPGIMEAYGAHIEEFELFQKHVRNFFESRSLSHYVHSIRHRIKDIDHLLEKVERKNGEGQEVVEDSEPTPVTEDNIFDRVTDVAGVRVLHLHTSQLEAIHNSLMSKVDDDEFTLFEQPKAYTWDPESGEYFERLGLRRELKESYYTSVHYVLRPNSKSHATCEVQVRTLLEEVWGEIDHSLNYPHPISDPQCKEQIRVLARLVGAGTHLADSIMRYYAGHS